LKTKKHQKNSETNQNESLTNHFESVKTFTCLYCNYTSKYKQNYNRHFTKCYVRIKVENDEKEETITSINLKTQLESKDKQITKLTETITDLKTQCKMDILTSENKLLTSENKLLKEHDKQVTNTNTNNAIGNHNNIHNVTQYIINNYPNAPNLKPIEHIEDIEKYISSDFNNSYANLIQDHYVKDIEPKDRSIWLVDSARDKYLTRLNDKWKIDMNGEEFCNLINNALSKALFQGKAILDENQDHVSKSIVLMELLLYVAQQQKLPKSKKSNFLLQNTI
jgi:hypothetical protein